MIDAIRLLPDRQWMSIFLMLDVNTQLKVSCVCKEFFSIIRSSKFSILNIHEKEIVPLFSYYNLLISSLDEESYQFYIEILRRCLESCEDTPFFYLPPINEKKIENANLLDEIYFALTKLLYHVQVDVRRDIFFKALKHDYIDVLNIVLPVCEFSDNDLSMILIDLIKNPHHPSKEQITEILIGHVSLNGRDSQDRTPLHWAVICDEPQVLSVLVRNSRISLNPKDSEGLTPLHHSIIKTSKSTFDLLLAGNAQINIFNHKRNSSLHLAVLAQWDYAVDRLLAFGAWPNVFNENGSTPLHLAVQNEFLNIT